METLTSKSMSPIGSPIKTSFFDDTKDTALFFSPGS